MPLLALRGSSVIGMYVCKIISMPSVSSVTRPSININIFGQYCTAPSRSYLSTACMVLYILTYIYTGRPAGLVMGLPPFTSAVFLIAN
jgi:hypothetical protein